MTRRGSMLVLCLLCVLGAASLDAATHIAAPQPPRRLVLHGISFAPHTAGIEPDAVPVLDEAAVILQRQGRAVVIVVAPESAVSESDDGQALVRLRAQSVRAYFVKHGVAPNQIASVVVPAPDASVLVTDNVDSTLVGLPVD